MQKARNPTRLGKAHVRVKHLRGPVAGVYLEQASAGMSVKVSKHHAQDTRVPKI